MKSTLIALALLALSPALANAEVSVPKQTVEINLGPCLLGFAATATSSSDPEVAKLIKNLKHVRVRVFDLAEKSRNEALEQIRALRKSVLDDSYSPIVTVTEKDNNDVMIHVKQGQGEILEGLIITVLDEKQEGVVVQIDGEIRADQIAKLTQNLNIKGVPAFTAGKPEKS